MLVRNATRGTVLATDLRAARSFWSRLRGLMLAPELRAGSGLLIERCRSIHTHFMRFDIDAVFVGPDLAVVAVVERMRPWRISGYYRRAASVVELPAGVVEATSTRVGDRLAIGGVEGQRV